MVKYKKDEGMILMNKEKLEFSSTKGCLNKKYKGSNLREELKKNESKILMLERKNELIADILNQKETVSVDFKEIEFIGISDEWVEGVETGEEYGVEEEFYFFDIIADDDDVQFTVMVEYLGRERDMFENVYEIHAPKMNEKQASVLKEKILEQFHFKTDEKIVFIDQFNSLQEELTKGFQKMVADSGFVVTKNIDGIYEEVNLIEKGNEYMVKGENEFIWVVLDDDSIEYFSLNTGLKIFPNI